MVVDVDGQEAVEVVAVAAGVLVVVETAAEEATALV